MFVKNFLTAGDFLTLVPVGIKVSLQYDDNGRIERVYKDWQDHADVTLDFLPKMLEDDMIPRKISVKTGSTFVYGVLYTPTLCPDPGELPQCVMDSLSDKFVLGLAKFNFFAGHVKSFGTTFRGANQIRQWLNFSKFHVLPGFVIPHDIDEVKFEKMATSNFPFKYPLISDYIEFGRDGVDFYSTNLFQEVVFNVEDGMDEDGSLYSMLTLTHEKLKIGYSEAVKYNVIKNTQIVLDESGNIIYSRSIDKRKRKAREDKITCPVCGNIYSVPKSGKCVCSDPHCNSRLYPRVTRMLKILSFPDISYDSYIKLTNKVGKVFSVVDVLYEDSIVDYRPNCTLPNLLRSIVPPEVMHGSDAFTLFCNKCNNSVDTVDYYLHNNRRIVTDLGMGDRADIRRFSEWLEDPINLSDILTLLHSDRVNLTKVDRKFDGAPIFRDKTIYITGKFKHGDIQEVTSILSSYSADVITSGDAGFDCIVVGDTKEDVNGFVIKHAKSIGVPIFTESEFFTTYGIDEDLAENL